MRPRSRLLSKRRLLLPTIREGTEESLRDLNEGNSLQAVSSEDYLLSICHLAHPTFPTRDFSTTNNHTQQFDSVHQRLRLSRLSATPSGILDLNPAGETLPIHMQQGEGKEMNGKLMLGNFDPLECLYGHQDNLAGGVRRALVQERFMGKHRSILEGQAHSRAHGIPRDSRPDLPRQCKSSSTELYTSTNISSQHSFTTLEAGRGCSADRGAEEERQNATAKQSLISRWISDCRSAWREARVRACMLPAIAEI